MRRLVCELETQRVTSHRKPNTWALNPQHPVCWEAGMLEGWDAAVSLSFSATLGASNPWTLESFLPTNWEKNLII